MKTFLEHLEDLRWVLIKSLVALGLGMLICLIGGNEMVGIIKKPLNQATVPLPRGTNQLWDIRWGTNLLKRVVLTDEQQAAGHAALTSLRPPAQHQPPRLSVPPDTAWCCCSQRSRSASAALIDFMLRLSPRLKNV